MTKAARNFVANPRARSVVIAIVIAALVAALTLLRPLDITIWSIQSKMFAHEPSGEIVLVTDRTGQAGKSVAVANRMMLDALEQLDKAGATRIVIDTPLRDSGQAELDSALRNRIASMRDRVVLAVPVDEAIFESSLREPNSKRFEGAAPMASSDLRTDFLGFVWEIEPEYSSGNAQYPALWTVLAGAPAGTGPIRPDYAINAESLPTVDIADLAARELNAISAVTGRQIIISGMGGDQRALTVPDAQLKNLPSASLHIVAAETYLRGAGRLFGKVVTIAGFGALLLLISTSLDQPRARRIGYGLWALCFVAAFVATASLGHRMMLADPLVIGLLYAVFRAVANYRRRHLYIDAQSRLPNFSAYRRDLETIQNIEEHVLVVAKIARLDAIFATLRSSEQGEYLRQVATRLRLGEGNTQVFHDGGKYLAMILRKADYADLEGHLEGLRAVASQAVNIAGQPIDVAITIGVDQSYGAPVANRISSAIAAADQAREAYRPVFVISDFETDSEEWDHSLQARLESALSENRISVKLQPKIDLRTGLFVGSEALARWTDRRHGEIPPSRFILQCERAGRLDELTKRVMMQSMEASRHLAALDLPAKVSVNVSAIQFVDSRIVDLVCMSLEETRADPANLMIEITETARIEDLRQASAVIDEIKALGLGFSIDDFGVGSGNLAALYELPFDELKIDRMFANEVTRSTRARAVVEALLKLSQDLGMRSVAEGIDHLSILETLREMGGDLAQGFCIARPQTLSLLEETLKLQRGMEKKRAN